MLLLLLLGLQVETLLLKVETVLLEERSERSKLK